MENHYLERNPAKKTCLQTLSIYNTGTCYDSQPLGFLTGLELWFPGGLGHH